MEKKWKILNSDSKERIFEDLNPIIERVLMNRGVRNVKEKQDFLYPDYYKSLSDSFELSGMKKAVERIQQALVKKEKVCIYGDYDADGVTSSCLLFDFLNQVGIDCFCYIPDRNKEGYGLNMKAIKYIKSKKANLIITVDCGISSVEEVGEVNKFNLDVIITDHHHIPEKIPQAAAVVNPKLDEKKENEYLAGVGVAFKLVQGVAKKLPDYDIENLKWFLDLVAIGTIADCVPLLNENRVLVKFGLVVLSKTRRSGLKQIFEVGKINIDENNLPSSQAVAFQIAPRINAAGRMDHANSAYELLICNEEDQAQARILALELESQNQHRQKVTKRMVDEVETKLKNKMSQKIIIENSSNWELGVIGLAAGKICDKYDRPVLLMKEEEGGSFRGSGRSTEEFNLIEALEKNKKYFEKYGGHRQAAGFSLKKENYKKLEDSLVSMADKETPQKILKTLKIDGKIELGDIDAEFIQQLKLLEPFGEGNREPMFLTENLEIVDRQLMGKKSDHLKIWLKDSTAVGVFIEAVGFGMGLRYDELKTGKKISVVFNVEENCWNGSRKVQLRLVDFRSAD